MAKKASHHGKQPAPLEPRIHRAVTEGRFQQALQLAKELHKQEPSPVTLELLKKTYLGRSKQLREEGYHRDAVTMMEAALPLDAASQSWLEAVAGEIAKAGGVRTALLLLEKLPPESPSLASIRAQAVDAALQLEAAGREQLPAAMHADFDRVVLAFKQLENAQDEQAKITLQEIGLRSPFLEWKVLLRGFQAYYQNDDVRALENWQRLAPERLPARLAAPFRCQLDPAYRAAQPPATQAALQSQRDRVQGSPLPQELRRLRQALADPDSLAAAFRQAEALLPQLKQQAPQLVPRLANCCYWEVISSGPDDVKRYQRVFGAPTIDPHFSRLQALAYDRGPDLDQAHKHWQAYEKELAQHPEIFPAGQAQPARALIWLHMGQNAAKLPSNQKLKKLPAFLRGMPDLPKPLKPGVEECFEHAIKLAPDQLTAYEELFNYLKGEDKLDKAVKVGRQLLERFPDHVPTLSALAEVLQKEKQYAESLALFQQALQRNPLDRELREKLSAARMFQARAEVEAGHFDTAREHYEAAASFAPVKDQWSILLRRAAAEFKAGAAEPAEALRLQALAQGAQPLAVSYVLLTEAIRLKLPKPLKSRFELEYKAGLAAPPIAEAALALGEQVASLKALGITFTGLKTQETAILKYLNKGQNAKWDAREIERAIHLLVNLKALPAARRFVLDAQRRFRDDPVFPLLEAMLNFQEKPERRDFYRSRWLLESAARLAKAMPESERKTKLLDDIQKQQQALAAMDVLGNSLQHLFGNMIDFDDDYEGDEDEDDGF